MYRHQTRARWFEAALGSLLAACVLVGGCSLNETIGNDEVTGAFVNGGNAKSALQAWRIWLPPPRR